MKVYTSIPFFFIKPSISIGLIYLSCQPLVDLRLLTSDDDPPQRESDFPLSKQGADNQLFNRLKSLAVFNVCHNFILDFGILDR